MNGYYTKEQCASSNLNNDQGNWWKLHALTPDHDGRSCCCHLHDHHYLNFLWENGITMESNLILRRLQTNLTNFVNTC